MVGVLMVTVQLDRRGGCEFFEIFSWFQISRFKNLVTNIFFFNVELIQISVDVVAESINRTRLTVDDVVLESFNQTSCGFEHPPLFGVNRCRKSCRLRWLNYLSPSIKRGVFREDEIDLMLKMHKLLGNRWSLIAGRLPGRTSNDVKNFWNTQLRHKSVSKNKDKEKIPTPKKVQVIKPLPMIFKSVPTWLTGEPAFCNLQEQQQEENQHPVVEDSIWWEELLFHDKEMNHGTFVSFGKEEVVSATNSKEEEKTVALFSDVGFEFHDFTDLNFWNFE